MIPIAPVHVSGHAGQDDQEWLINLLHPRFFVPIHGELRHLKRHAKTARAMGIPDENIAVIENGTVLTLTEERLEIGERVPGGYVFVDGALVGELGPKVMREREALGENGFVTALVRYDRQAGQPVGRAAYSHPWLCLYPRGGGPARAGAWTSFARRPLSRRGPRLRRSRSASSKQLARFLYQRNAPPSRCDGGGDVRVGIT